MMPESMDVFSIPQTHVERFTKSLRMPGRVEVTRASVEHAIRVAFAASLLTNEHRPCSFRIGWVQPESAAVLLRFEAPLAFEVGEVRRLAAASGRSSMIGVCADGIWGLGQRLSNCEFFVDAFAPGCLKLGGWSTAASLVVEPDRTTFVGEAGGLPMSTIAGLIKNDHPVARRRFAIGQSIANVLIEMRRLGHGGTLIVLGRGWTDFNDHFSNWEPASVPSTQVPDLIDSILNPPEWTQRSPMLQQHTAAASANLEALLRTYAELSLMDGAVVLDADLSLLGIGAKLSAKGDPMVECVWPSDPPRTATVGLAQLGGTAISRQQGSSRVILTHLLLSSAPTGRSPPSSH